MDLSIARKHIERLYVDACNIYEYQKVRASDGSTNVDEVLVHENVPCKISHRNTGHTKDGLGDTVFLVSELIINPDIVVKAGSRIVVTRNGVSTTYKNSGEPARFLNHQEIKLDLEEDMA